MQGLFPFVGVTQGVGEGGTPGDGDGERDGLGLAGIAEGPTWGSVGTTLGDGLGEEVGLSPGSLGTSLISARNQEAGLSPLTTFEGGLYHLSGTPASAPSMNVCQAGAAT